MKYMHCIIASLALLVLPTNLAAIVPGWSSEQISTITPVTAIKPVAQFSGVDAHGNFFAVWQDRINGNGVAVAAIYRPGLGWLPEIILSDPAQNVGIPTATIKENGEAYVIWSNFSLGEVEAAVNPNIGALNWLTPVQISNTVAAGNELDPDSLPIISSASQINAVVAVWLEGPVQLDEPQVYANWNNGFGWNISNVQRLSTNNNISSLQPNVNVGNGGIAIAAWAEEHITPDFFTAVYANVFRFDTLAWEPVSTPVSSTAAGSHAVASIAQSQAPAVVVSGFGIGFLAWHITNPDQTNDIQIAFYQPGGSFTAPITFTETFPPLPLDYVQPKLVQNDEGVTWLGFLGINLFNTSQSYVFASSTLISTQGAPQFTTPVAVNQPAPPAPFYPPPTTLNFDIAINGLGNALFTWSSLTEIFASSITLGQAPLPQQLVYASTAPLAAQFNARLSNTNVAEVFIFDNITSFSVVSPAVDVIAVRGVGVVAPQNAPNFSGYTVENRTLSRKFPANKLSWNVTVDPTVASYQLFRNGVQIAAFPVSAPHSYTDVLFDPGIPNTYTLYSLDANGLMSEGVSVALNQ